MKTVQGGGFVPHGWDAHTRGPGLGSPPLFQEDSAAAGILPAMFSKSAQSPLSRAIGVGGLVCPSEISASSLLWPIQAFDGNISINSCSVPHTVQHSYSLWWSKCNRTP